MGQVRPVLVLTGSGFKWALSQGEPSTLNPYTTVDADRTEENRKGYLDNDTPCLYRENCTFSRQVTRAKVNQLVHSDLQDPDNVADLQVGEKVLVVDIAPDVQGDEVIGWCRVKRARSVGERELLYPIQCLEFEDNF
jgi:hypothetical protein